MTARLACGQGALPGHGNQGCAKIASFHGLGTANSVQNARRPLAPPVAPLPE
jgi:hypothetical protein